MAKKGKDQYCGSPLNIAGVNNPVWGLIEQGGNKLTLPRWARSGRGFRRLQDSVLGAGSGVGDVLREIEIQGEYLRLRETPFDKRTASQLERLDQLDKILLNRE